MLRKLLILVAVLAVIGAAVFWLVTMPATVPASALAAHTPDLENGKTCSTPAAAPPVMRRPIRRTRPGSAAAWG